MGKKLLARIAQNIKDDVLYSDESLQYRGGIGSYYNSLPDAISSLAVIEKYIYDPDIRTPWGFGHPSPMSGYREWPWSGAMLAIAIAHNTASKAFPYLTHCAKYASATGALPEKIRIDGYSINYYYSSTHGVFAWAMLFALCHTDKDGSLRLLFGLDGSWKKLDFHGIRAMGGLEVSAEIRDCMVVSMKIINHATDAKKFIVRINPVYETSFNNKEVAINPHKHVILI